MKKRPRQAVPSTLRTSRQRFPEQKNHHFQQGKLEVEEGDNSEGDGIPEESVLEESDEESEARVTEAFLTGWRAMQKIVGVWKGRGFQGQTSVPEGSEAQLLFPKNVNVIPARIRV